MPGVPLTGRRPVFDPNRLEIEDLVELMRGIDDPRKKGTLHDFASILAVGLCARLSGVRTYLHMSYWTKELTQDLLQRFGCRLDENKRRYIPPSEPTIRRAFQAVDNQRLHAFWPAGSNSGYRPGLQPRARSGAGVLNQTLGADPFGKPR